MSQTDDPTAWHAGFAKLSPSILPCPGFRSDEWREIHAVTKLFIETRAAEAAGKGWTGLDLFSVHETVGAANVSALGPLMVGTAGEAPGEMTPKFLRLGHMRYCKMPRQSAVLVWAFRNA